MAPENINRRAVLALGGTSLLGGLAGCVIAPNFPTVKAVDAGTSVDSVAFDVSVTRQYTRRNPATIQVSLRNTVDTKLSFKISSPVPFPRQWLEQANGSNKLYLSTGRAVPRFAGLDGCWRAHGSDRYGDPIELPTLDPGEMLTETFAVLDYPESGPCLPRDEYTQTTGIMVAVDNSEEYTSVDLHLTLQLD